MIKPKKQKIENRSEETEISEIFSSLQGEGPYLGSKQIFVRFGRCNMHCVYCDELEKMKEGRFETVSLERLVGEIDALEAAQGPHHSVSLTGGEPLFYTPFLKSLLPELKARGMKTYLETNGTLPRELEKVVRWCDVIAMDFKPSSSTGDRDFFDEHRSFLKTALQKEVFVKLVVTPATDAEEVRRAVRLLSETNPAIPFILQPRSDLVGINKASLDLIEGTLFGIAKASLHDVRVIPQMHKIWGVR